MNILDADFTLYEIEQTLEERFRMEEKMLRTIGDLDLSYEDYKYLVLKLKGISKYMTRIEVFEQYKLSIITALVFSIRYEKKTAFYLYGNPRDVNEDATTPIEILYSYQ